MIALVFYNNVITKKNALFFRRSKPLHFSREKRMGQTDRTNHTLTHT